MMLGVAGRVDADKSPAASDISFEGGLLCRIEDIPGGEEEDHDLVSRQCCIGEARGILGGVNGKTVLGAERPDRGNAVRDRVMAKLGGLGKDEHGKGSGGRLRRGAAERQAENGQRAQQPPDRNRRSRRPRVDRPCCGPELSAGPGLEAGPLHEGNCGGDRDQCPALR